MLDAADAPDPDRLYANYLRTCAMLGIEQTPRERAFGLIVGSPTTMPPLVPLHSVRAQSGAPAQP